MIELIISFVSFTFLHVVKDWVQIQEGPITSSPNLLLYTGFFSKNKDMKE